MVEQGEDLMRACQVARDTGILRDKIINIQNQLVLLKSRMHNKRCQMYAVNYDGLKLILPLANGKQRKTTVACENGLSQTRWTFRAFQTFKERSNITLESVINHDDLDNPLFGMDQPSDNPTNTEDETRNGTPADSSTPVDPPEPEAAR